MHSVFALDVRYKGEDDSDDFDRVAVAMFTGKCPACDWLIHASTTRFGSGCSCEGVTWRLNVTVTTDDLPPFAWTISTVRSRALQVIAEAAGTHRGRVGREVLKKLTAEFGKKAVNDAIDDCATGGEDSAAAGIWENRPQPVARRRTAGLQETLAPAQALHPGQRSVTAPNPLRARLTKDGIDPKDGSARFKGWCDHCNSSFSINSASLTARCKCENVRWRLNIAITTHDFPPHSWDPETIRKAAMQDLLSRIKWEQCKASTKLWDQLKSEFSGRAVYSSIIEV